MTINVEDETTLSIYCLKCKAHQTVDTIDTEVVITKNGRNARRADCPNCDKTLFRFTK